MIKVAQWKARGIHAGQVVTLRKVTPVHIWRVIVKIKLPVCADVAELDQRVFTASAPCTLTDMYRTVMEAIGEVIADGEKVRDASMEFFIKGRA